MNEYLWEAQTTHRGSQLPTPATGLNGTSHTPAARPLPHGVADYFWDEAAQRKDLEIRLYELFQRWGYSLVIPPTFEYAETFYARADAHFQTEMYRFPDKDGTLLALRPEMTIPVARLAATRLHDVPAPQRYCYMGSVFRYIEPRAGRQREFFQAGMELIDAPAPEADAEVVALTAAAVEAAEIETFQLVLGQLGYFHGLMGDLNLPAALGEQLRQAIDRNSEPQLTEFLAQTSLQRPQRMALEALSGLRGHDVFAVIQQAEQHCLNSRMRSALATLRSICTVLAGYDLLDRAYLDLTEINNLGYYTGLSFEVLTPQTGFSLGGGGRYDTLLNSFGHDKPAVGAALGIDRLLHARHLQHLQQENAPRVQRRPQIEVMTQGDPACLPYIAQWRRAGLSVALQFKTESTTELDAAPTPGLGAQAFAVWTGSGFEVHWQQAGQNLSAPQIYSGEALTSLVDDLVTELAKQEDATL